jgi:hypothetical protein
MSSQQVSGKRMLEKYEIEFNGTVFNCLECNKNNCCSTISDASNRVACQKCRCQQLYTVKDGTRSGSEPVGNLGCVGCTTNMSEAECNSYEFLNNKVIQNMSIVDCSNKIITAGANNSVKDVSLKSTCNTGGPTQVNNVSTDVTNTINIGPITTNTTVLAVGGGTILMIVILIMLFR